MLANSPMFQTGLRAFFGATQPELIDWTRAKFRDTTVEAGYRKHIIDNEAPKDRLINYAGIAIYYLFGVLDFLTFSNNLAQVLVLRWAVCGPLALFIVSLSYLPRYRQHFMLGTAAVMILGSFSIIAMIGMAPVDNAPPYIIGIFAVFILFACIQRMDFRTGALIYVVSFALWFATVTIIAPRNETEIYSGVFFFTWISLVSIATNYFQEIRSRLDYYRGKCLAENSEYIEQLLIEATAADKSKLNFLSILSHELRTPLHQIIGFTEVLQATPERQNLDHLNQIHTSAVQLLGRIGKMLRYADATAGTIRYDVEPTSASELVESALDQCRESARNADVTVRADSMASAVLKVDTSHTIYALTNIIENAISASKPKQSVVISGRNLASGGYEIKIADAGCGMTREQIDAAFKPFSIAQDVRSRSIEGIGLGLTLADKVFRDQSAQLSLESEPGAGTTVSVVFASETLDAAA